MAAVTLKVSTACRARGRTKEHVHAALRKAPQRPRPSAALGRGGSVIDPTERSAACDRGSPARRHSGATATEVAVSSRLAVMQPRDGAKPMSQKRVGQKPSGPTEPMGALESSDRSLVNARRTRRGSRLTSEGPPEMTQKWAVPTMPAQPREQFRSAPNR
jgi:hypothetical protein